MAERRVALVTACQSAPDSAPLQPSDRTPANPVRRGLVARAEDGERSSPPPPRATAAGEAGGGSSGAEGTGAGRRMGEAQAARVAAMTHKIARWRSPISFKRANRLAARRAYGCFWRVLARHLTKRALLRPAAPPRWVARFKTSSPGRRLLASVPAFF